MSALEPEKAVRRETPAATATADAVAAVRQQIKLAFPLPPAPLFKRTSTTR